MQACAPAHAPRRLLVRAQVPAPAAEAASSLEVTAVNVQPSAAVKGQQFSWTRTWYPLVGVDVLGDNLPVDESELSGGSSLGCPGHGQYARGGPTSAWSHLHLQIAVDYLDPHRPTQLTVLGHNLAVWRDADGEWRCFQDRCPHRAAPLSGLSWRGACLRMRLRLHVGWQAVPRHAAGLWRAG